MATAAPAAGLTAAEFSRRPDPGYPEELVRGVVVRMAPPGARHGQICAEILWILTSFVKAHDLGHVVSNDSGVVTRRGPDTVRGADVAFYSYARIPKGPLPAQYPDVAPELVFEVRSPSDRWVDVLSKVTEYLEAGVVSVCVVDPEASAAQVFHADRPVRVLSESDELEFPEALPGFRVAVGRLLG